jgi:hypothetical protein
VGIETIIAGGLGFGSPVWYLPTLGYGTLVNTPSPVIPPDIPPVVRTIPGIAYAGVELIQPTAELLAWAEQELDFSLLYQRPVKDQWNRPTKLNSLWWPTGATRWAEAFFLCNNEQMNAIKTATGGAGVKPATLSIHDGTDHVDAVMWMLPPRMLTAYPPEYSPSGANLWLLILVDERYAWQQQRTGDLDFSTEADPADWEDVVVALATVIGFSYAQDIVDDAYLTVPVQCVCRDESATEFLDRVLHATGQRLVRQLDGTVEILNVEPSKERLLDNQQDWLGRELATGGLLHFDLSANNDLPAVLPSTINVLFQDEEDGVTQDTHTTVSVTLAETGLTGELGSNTNTFPRNVNSLSVAVYTSGVWDNEADLDALAVKLAGDWYSYWGFADHDLEVWRTAPWEFGGLDDWVEWTASIQKYSTRARRPPYDVDDKPPPYAAMASSASSALTVEDTDGSPSYPNVVDIKIAQFTGLTLTQPFGYVANQVRLGICTPYAEAQLGAEYTLTDSLANVTGFAFLIDRTGIWDFHLDIVAVIDEGTTLANLIIGLYDETSGYWIIDGITVDTYQVGTALNVEKAYHVHQIKQITAAPATVRIRARLFVSTGGASGTLRPTDDTIFPEAFNRNGCYGSAICLCADNPPTPPSGTLTYDVAGDYDVVIPTGVTSVSVQCWGPGGDGADGTGPQGGGAGGGGAYATDSAIAVTPGNTYSFTVRAGGSATVQSFTGDGGETVVADYGRNAAADVGGAAGTAGASTGTTKYDGGAGGDGTGALGGGGGGSSAGTGVSGTDGTDGGSGAGGTGGAAPTGGGDGGDGGFGTGNGTAGTAPGGGGGGGGGGVKTPGTGAAGAAGKVILSY